MHLCKHCTGTYAERGLPTTILCCHFIVEHSLISSSNYSFLSFLFEYLVCQHFLSAGLRVSTNFSTATVWWQQDTDVNSEYTFVLSLNFVSSLLTVKLPQGQYLHSAHPLTDNIVAFRVWCHWHFDI